MNSLISIIIPVYNRADLIAQTLDTLIGQTYSNWECIIIDDESTDHTVSIIEKYLKLDNRFQLHFRPKDTVKGANACRNYGFELSKGRFVKWFDSDDLMSSDLLEKQLLSIANFDCSVCKISHYDLDNNKFLKEDAILSQNLIEDYLIGNVAFYISGPLWKRTFLEAQKSLFDTKISNLDDWDFNLRMLYANPKINFIEESLIKYRIHENSLSKEIVKLNFDEILSEFKARKKHLVILLFKKNIETSDFKKFIAARNKYYLREALLLKNGYDYYLFKNLIFTQFLLLDITGIFKSFVGYFGLKFFKKGYILFK